MSKQFISLSLYMLLCAIIGLFFYLSPVSLAKAENKSFILSFVYCSNEKKNSGGWVMTFEPAGGKYRLIKATGKVKLSGSIYDKAYELRKMIDGVEPSKKDFFYACIDEDIFLEMLPSFSGSWRQEPEKLLSFTSDFARFFSGSRSNLNLADKLSVYFEILRARPLDFSYTEFNEIKDETEDKQSDKKLLSGKIKIRFTDASGRKNEIEKTLSFLRDKGFDIIDLRRAPRRKKTEIISYYDDTYAARKLAWDLGINNLSIIVKKEKYNIYEAEIIAGEDFAFIK